MLVQIAKSSVFSSVKTLYILPKKVYYLNV